MSEKIDIIIDSSVDVETENEIVSVSTDNNVDIEILEPEYDVSINKREYVITGDNLYIPKTYDESPQWLKDIIGTITDFTLNQKLTEIGALSSTLTGLIAELEVAKNAYTNSIITSAEIDERINTRIETLNSSIAESDATIVDLIATKATPTEASSLALNVLTASINDGAISSLVSNLQNAISTTNSTLSNNIDIVHSEMTGDFEATSDAISGLQTYIGVDNDGTENGTGLLSDVKVLQKQNDGVIETTTGTYDVMIGIEDPNNNTDNDQLDVTKEPYASWKALDVANENTFTRSSHVGDIYIKYTNANEGYKTYDKAYKFIKTIPDSTSPYSTDSEGFTWALITDTDAQNAYVAAINALDLADSKRRVFIDTPTVPYDAGDLWVRVVNGSNQIWRCNVDGATSYSITHWVIASTDDTATVALQTGLENGTATVKLTNAYVGTVPFTTYVASEIDSKVGVYSGEAAPIAGQPSGVAINDIYLWFTTASKVLANGTTQVYDITRTYKYSGSAWAEITTDSNITALADLADGKRTVFGGNSVPTGAVDRDVWIPSATNGSYLQGEIYQYSGTAWIIATKYTENLDNFVSNVYEPTISDIQSQVDGQVNYYFYESLFGQTPASISGSDGWNAEAKKDHHGDIAYDKTTNTGYYYDRITSVWIFINSTTNAGLIEALKAASIAQATADGKVSHMYGVYQSATPATDGTYKYWLTTSKILKVLSGASWIDFSVSKLDVGDIVTVWDSVLRDEFKYYWNGTTWYSQVSGGLVAGSKAFTDLDTSLEQLGTTVSGHTSQLSTVDARIVDGVATVDSKWEYNSNLVINGVSYNSGFGLSNSAGTGVGSEFWIDASKLKFTNSAKTGSKSPFTIDANGTTPEITFNGKVTFSNVDGVPISSTNLIAEDWTISNGSTAMYVMNGGVSENVRVLDKNHNNEYVVLWTCVPDVSGGASGGWDTIQFDIDKNKTYRFTVFIKKNSTSGSVHFGCGDNNTVTTLNTSIKDSNPYFWYGDLPTINEWYLLVGYVYPAGQTGIVSHGGIYRCADAKKVVDISGFNWASDASTSSHRCYDYYNTDTSSRQWMWNPRVEVINGEEPSILDLIGKADVSGDINTNNDVFAQKLGYASYAAMVSAASSGQTVIVGGHVNTNLISAGAINAGMINTVGLIAEDISTTTLTGKTIEGSVINGAVINGAVIKASYLDLDGELEILTNYHITPAMYAANPGLYTDAVYIEAASEWRIPSTSNLIVGYQDYTLATGQVATCTDIRSYNCANVGHNRKAVKVSPTFNNSSKIFISSYMAVGHNTYPATWQLFHFRCGSDILFTVQFSNSVYTMNSQSVSTAIITSPYFDTVNLNCSTYGDDGVHAVIVNNVPFLGATEFKVTSTLFPPGEYVTFNDGYGEFFVKILDATSTPSYAWNNPDSMLNVYCDYTHDYVYEQPPIKVNFNGIRINNMI